MSRKYSSGPFQNHLCMKQPWIFIRWFIYICLQVHWDGGVTHAQAKAMGSQTCDKNKKYIMVGTYMTSLWCKLWTTLNYSSLLFLTCGISFQSCFSLVQKGLKPTWWVGSCSSHFHVCQRDNCGQISVVDLQFPPVLFLGASHSPGGAFVRGIWGCSLFAKGIFVSMLLQGRQPEAGWEHREPGCGPWHWWVNRK